MKKVAGFVKTWRSLGGKFGFAYLTVMALVRCTVAFSGDRNSGLYYVPLRIVNISLECCLSLCHVSNVGHRFSPAIKWWFLVMCIGMCIHVY